MGSGALPADRATSSCEPKACQAVTPPQPEGVLGEDTDNPAGPRAHQDPQGSGDWGHTKGQGKRRNHAVTATTHMRPRGTRGSWFPIQPIAAIQARWAPVALERTE